MAIQGDWTDADGVAPERLPAPAALFTTTALLDLVALVDALRARS